MPRGGKRSGRSGQSYGNRSDLQQAVRTAPSERYGERVAQERAQGVIPLPAQAGAAGASPAASAPMEPPPPFGRPTDRPAEPLTAGLPLGPGAGPVGVAPAVNPVAETLRAALAAFPNDAIEALLRSVE